MKRTLSILTVLLLFAQITQAGEHAPGAATSPPVSPTVCPPNAQICTLAGSGTLTPIQAALAKLTASSTAYEATAGSLAVAQAVVDQLTPTAKALATQVQADQAALAALVGVPTPNPTPVPVGPQVSLLVIGSTTCVPCIAMHPDIDALKASGVPISRTDTDTDPTAAKWAVTATPTTIVLVDGKEVQRYVGKLDKAALSDWYTKIQAWVKAGGGK